ncbi:MAG: TIGR03905 family TSCPD domain-containing protein [Acutalibacteraceae bacterium]
MKYSYNTKGTCSTKIDLEVKDNKIVSVSYTGGCNGNLKGVSRLVEGMDIDEAISKLKGIRCGFKPTSCPDQLAVALEEVKAKCDERGGL